MSMLAMAHSLPHQPFTHEFAWDEPRQSDYAARCRAEERIALPSIRQAIPELGQFHALPSKNNASTMPAISPVVGLGVSDLPAEEERSCQVPRLYRSPAPGSRAMSPTSLASRSVTDSWGSSSRTSPFVAQGVGSFPAMRSPATMDAIDRIDTRLEPRPTLPSLPQLNFDRDSTALPRMRGLAEEGYAPGRPGPLPRHHSPVADAGLSGFRHGSGYFPSYPPPSRLQSHSFGSMHPHDRRPFSNGYGGHDADYMRYGDLGMSGDNKQRKRRGNLPKETTDKLRAWFVAHLQHPYPTEDEKQEFMRQTGLQMNQISNWFINARRRQLPAMIENARVEHNAVTARLGVAQDGRVLPTTERGDYSDANKCGSVPLSEGEGSAYDDQLESLQRRGASTMTRESV